MTIPSTLRHVAVLVLAVGLAGCSKATPPAAAPTTAARPSPTWTPPTDASGLRACEAVKKANAALAVEPDLATLKRWVVVEGEQSNNVSLRLTAHSLGLTIEIAEAAKGQSDEGIRKIAVSTAALDMETACIRNGYIRPGS